MSDLDLASPNTVDHLLSRNAEFADRHDVAGLPLLPTGGMIVIGCVDPRVDPALVMGLEPGEAVVIRNIGGRVTPGTMRTLALLAAINRSTGTRPGDGWNLVVVHHSDCGITRLLGHPDALAAELGVSPDTLDPDSITDPRASLAVDIQALQANPMLPSGLIVSGLLYHTAAGRLEVEIPPSRVGRP
jgi:carbonic anhydrase